MSYEMIDRFLRNNLDDEHYAEYSAALDELCSAQRTWVGLTLNELDNFEKSSLNRQALCCAIEAKLKEKNT